MTITHHDKLRGALFKKGPQRRATLTPTSAARSPGGRALIDFEHRSDRKPREQPGRRVDHRDSS
jgi:hypothetical protein